MKKWDAADLLEVTVYVLIAALVIYLFFLMV